MKVFPKSILIAFLLINFSATTIKLKAGSKLKDPSPKQFEKYLSSLGSEIFSSIDSNKDRELRQVQSPLKRARRHKGVSMETLLKKARKLRKTANNKPRSRELYESLSNDFLMGQNDDTSTTNQLSNLISEQKAMGNYRTVGTWLVDFESVLDDLRDSVNRRISDLATGLQRRNLLLGHYNYMGLGLSGGNTAWPQTTSTANLGVSNGYLGPGNTQTVM